MRANIMAHMTLERCVAQVERINQKRSDACGYKGYVSGVARHIDNDDDVTDVWVAVTWV